MSAPAGAADGERRAVEASRNIPFLGGFLRETRILYPEEIGGWTARGEKVYDHPAQGVSVRYAREDRAAWIDVFFYPAGVIDREAFARAAEAERESLREARLQAGEQEPDLSALEPFLSLSGPGEEAIPPGYSLDGLLHMGGRAYDSAMTVALDRMYFVKGRMSRPAGEGTRGQLRGELEDFMRALALRLLISSRGHCWDAPLGDGRHGRDVPGCVGLDSPDPAVEEGMRQIRIEYPPPPVPPRLVPRGAVERG